MSTIFSIVLIVSLSFISKIRWYGPDITQATDIYLLTSTTTTSVQRPFFQVDLGQLVPTPPVPGWNLGGLVELGFYEQDVRPNTQQSASKHSKECKPLTLTNGLTSSLLHQPSDSWQKIIAPFTPALKCHYQIFSIRYLLTNLYPTKCLSAFVYPEFSSIIRANSTEISTVNPAAENSGVESVTGWLPNRQCQCTNSRKNDKRWSQRRRLRPQCRHLMTWMKHTLSLIWPISCADGNFWSLTQISGMLVPLDTI